MTSFTWQQVTAWRFAQHGLAQRAPHGELIDVVSRIGALHAQLMSAAELSLWARVEAASPADLSTGLWQDRTLVKTWAMRGTLHILAARDYPMVVAAMSKQVDFAHLPPSYFRYHGIEQDELAPLVENIGAALNGEPLTREKLADAVAARMGNPKMGELLRSGWGSLLKPAARLGDLCFGPDQGRHVTFVRPSEWLGAALMHRKAQDPDQALQEIARRYLNAYGPATFEEFAHWWGFRAPAARRVFEALGDEVEPVTIEGRKAYALAAALPRIAAMEPPVMVRLLPHFDPYIIAISPHYEHVGSDAARARIYRPQAWIYPAVLVDGRIVGMWELDKKKKTALTVELYERSTPDVKDRIAAEVARLGEFLGKELRLGFVTP